MTGHFTSTGNMVSIHAAGSKWLQAVKQLNNWIEADSFNWYCAKKIRFVSDADNKCKQFNCRMRITIHQKITKEIINCGSTPYPFDGYVTLYSLPSNSDEIITSAYDYHSCEARRLAEFLLECSDTCRCTCPRYLTSHIITERSKHCKRFLER